MMTLTKILDILMRVPAENGKRNIEQRDYSFEHNFFYCQENQKVSSCSDSPEFYLMNLWANFKWIQRDIWVIVEIESEMELKIHQRVHQSSQRFEILRLQ